MCAKRLLLGLCLLLGQPQTSFAVDCPQDLAEDEAINNGCGIPPDPSPQGINCRCTMRPAAIDSPGDADYIYLTGSELGGYLTVGTLADGGSPAGDTMIEIFPWCSSPITPPCDPPGSCFEPFCPTLLASDDNGGPGSYSLVSNLLIPVDQCGRPYVAKITHAATGGTGTYKAFVLCVPLTEVQNPGDTCGGATVLPCEPPMPISGTTCVAYDDNYDLPVGNSCIPTGRATAGNDRAFAIVVGADTHLRATLSMPMADAIISWSVTAGTFPHPASLVPISPAWGFRK